MENIENIGSIGEYPPPPPSQNLVVETASQSL